MFKEDLRLFDHAHFDHQCGQPVQLIPWFLLIDPVKGFDKLAAGFVGALTSDEGLDKASADQRCVRIESANNFEPDPSLVKLPQG